MPPCNEKDRRVIDAALQLLGIRRFALAIHDASFPSATAEDIGRGSPYSEGGLGFLRFARSLGFNAIQMGPQGKTPRHDPSPYNGCIFAKSVLSLAAHTLAQDDRLAAVVTEADLDRLLARRAAHEREEDPERIDYALAWEVSHGLLDVAHTRFRALRDKPSAVNDAFDHFLTAQQRADGNWLERDSVYEALAHASGLDDWRRWGERGSRLLPLDARLYCPDSGEERATRERIAQVMREYQPAIERFAFGQFLLHVLHERLRQEARSLGLLLYGDMHIGCAHQDWWAWRSVFLPGYLLGAPPSRTNPEGQPWGYPVLDPRWMWSVGPRGETVRGPTLAFVQARAGRMLADFDGMRIDHPQGLVCPWVYRADDPDPLRAVRDGARLYSAPNLAAHPELRQFALVGPDQLNQDASYPLYGDDQVVRLEPDQVERFAVVLDVVLDSAQRAGRNPDDILCEVLSTWPTPLKAVMQRRGMGRFCITQKADPHNPHDIYRPEKTSPNDWIMAGNHDTKPLWLVAEERKATPWFHDRAQLLAQRLVPQPERRQEFAARAASDPRRFCEAMFAELFLGPARNVSVFFADLFGERRQYNEPGTTRAQNWTLRVPGDYQLRYAERLERGEALDVKRVLALALHARAQSLGPEAGRLAEQLASSSV